MSDKTVSNVSQVSAITTPSAVATTSAPTTSNSGNRNRNRNRKKNDGAASVTSAGQTSSAAPRVSNFKGNTSEMNGHVFELFSECKSEKQYQQTVDVLSEYARKHMVYSDDILHLIKKLVMPTMKKPAPIDPKTADETDKELFTLDCKDYHKRTRTLTQNIKSLYGVVWGQCSVNMQGQLKSLTGFDDADDTSDCIWLLQSIKGAAFSFDEERYLYCSLDDHLVKYVMYRQGPGEALASYLHQYRIFVEVYEHYGGMFTGGQIVLDTIPDTVPPLTYAERKAKVRDRMIAFGFLKRSDPKRYGTLLSDLANDYARGVDAYPATISAAYKLLHSFTKAPPEVVTQRVTVQNPVSAPTSDMTFAQAAAAVPGSDGVTRPKISCNKCDQHGHYPDKCPSVSGVQMFQSAPEPSECDFSFSQVAQPQFDVIPAQWVLLDSQSTVSVFRNPKYLHNIRASLDSNR